MRIDEALDAGMEMAELVEGARADIVERGRIVDPPPLPEDRDEQLVEVGFDRNLPAARHVLGIDDRGPLRRRSEELIPDHVGHELSVVAEAAHLEEAGGGDLDGLFGELDLVLPGAARLADG